jgi:hypothetical protein
VLAPLVARNFAQYPTGMAARRPPKLLGSNPSKGCRVYVLLLVCSSQILDRTSTKLWQLPFYHCMLSSNEHHPTAFTSPPHSWRRELRRRCSATHGHVLQFARLLVITAIILCSPILTRLTTGTARHYYYYYY